MITHLLCMICRGKGKSKHALLMCFLRPCSKVLDRKNITEGKVKTGHLKIVEAFKEIISVLFSYKTWSVGAVVSRTYFCANN